MYRYSLRVGSPIHIYCDAVATQSCLSQYVHVRAAAAYQQTWWTSVHPMWANMAWGHALSMPVWMRPNCVHVYFVSIAVQFYLFKFRRAFFDPFMTAQYICAVAKVWALTLTCCTYASLGGPIECSACIHNAPLAQRPNHHRQLSVQTTDQ